MLLAALAIPAGLAAANNPGPAERRCTKPYFSPLERNTVVDDLAPKIALDLGKSYKGSVATFTVTPRGSEQLWIDTITTDWQLWYHNGNDLRTIGLRQYRIPTLMQSSIAITLQFYLTVLEFLSRSTTQASSGPHQLHPPAREDDVAVGRRFVIADKMMPFGSERLEMAVKPSEHYASPIRLYELADPNLGDYSPTEVVKAGSTPPRCSP